MRTLPFVINVETIAGDSTPEQTCHDLHELATRLGCMVQTDINDRRVFAHPGQSKEDVYRNWSFGPER